MKNIQTKLFLIVLLHFALPNLILAQSSSSDLSSYFVPSLIVIVAFVVIGGIITVADNMLKLEAQKLGADSKNKNYGLFPKFSDMFRPKVPDHVKGQKVHFLKKGHNILLQGEAKKSIEADLSAKTFAIKPGNFLGLSPIPKVEVAVGDEVKAGDALFYDKKLPEIIYVAPVSGEVIAINRGAKRSIKEIIILADKDLQHK
ncbi:MAG: NADH:ubiquinone reductase (Na(+)-transporting) subunit A, partial [Bacteroidia bacterium]|nr:NADH:ubiquinone reductase (Na(+)-transporting) subunit A [Bacteroidia bacterium]